MGEKTINTSSLGLIVGTGLLDSNLISPSSRETVKTDYGIAIVYEFSDIPLIQRHDSPQGYRAPHAINHQANISALKQSGVEKIIAMNSVGSLNPEIVPGSFVIPDDFIDPWSATTFYDDERSHGVAEFSPTLREFLVKSSRQTPLDIHDKGTYLQTNGPRFETEAEADLFSNYAEIIGMTAATEISLASQLDLKYATVCSVDNYVNGINQTSVDMQSFKQSVEENLPNVEKIFETILTELNINFRGDAS